jgi:hypothetical protein
VCGAVPHAALDTAQGRADATEEIRVADANAQADWHVGPFDATHVAGGALNRIDAATAMPLLMLPHAQSETMRLPAYGR